MKSTKTPDRVETERQFSLPSSRIKRQTLWPVRSTRVTFRKYSFVNIRRFATTVLYNKRNSFEDPNTTFTTTYNDISLDIDAGELEKLLFHLDGAFVLPSVIEITRKSH